MISDTAYASTIGILSLHCETSDAKGAEKPLPLVETNAKENARRQALTTHNHAAVKIEKAFIIGVEQDIRR